MSPYGADTNPVFIYTDGSCMPNPGPGGWAAIIIEDGKPDRIIKGSCLKSTNNRMELTAALEAIGKIPKEKEIVLSTDSQYLKNGVEKWMDEWIARQWRRKGGKLANEDLWKLLNTEIDERKIKWKWVRGHAGNKYNDLVDRLAREEMLTI